MLPGRDPAEPFLHPTFDSWRKKVTFYQVIVVVDVGDLFKVILLFFWISKAIKGVEMFQAFLSGDCFETLREWGCHGPNFHIALNLSLKVSQGPG